MTTIHVHVYLKPAHLVILLTFFANQSDPYLIFYDLKKISDMSCMQSYCSLVGKITHIPREELYHTHTHL